MRNGQPVRTNTLVQSSQDMIELGEAVEERFIAVVNLHERSLGFPLLPPTELQNDMLLWRAMVVRHRTGDRRHTADEKRATRRIAQWTLDNNCLLRNQPLQKLEWKD